MSTPGRSDADGTRPAPAAPTVSMVYERDVPVPVADGTVLRANVYRPIATESGATVPAPVLMTFGPYGKDLTLAMKAPEKFTAFGSGVFLNWETPDPEHWVPRGYAVVRVDSRGSGTSPGVMDVFSAQQARDFHDAVEWAGTQPWSTGKVGLLGVSYYAASQWAVAALRPPHLAAVLPWEGAGDVHRDFERHGGILNAGFMTLWSDSLEETQFGVDGSVDAEQRARDRVRPVDAARAHPLDDETYRSWLPDPAAIEVPLLSVGNWGNTRLHLRGNTELYERASSAHKWLRIVVGDHFSPFYAPENLAMEEKFLGWALKGEDTGWEAEPAVRVVVRHADHDEQRDLDAWPPSRAALTRYHLDAAAMTLGPEEAAAPAQGSWTTPDGGVSFTSGVLERPLEVLGPVGLHLWLSAQATDADVYVRLRHLDADGQDCWGVGSNGEPTPLARGWLRASQRALDPTLTRPDRPYHSHDREQPLVPGEAVELEVEIWPTSIALDAGHALVLDVSHHDDGPAVLRMDGDDGDDPVAGSVGTTTVLTGPDHPSWLVLPVVAR